MNEITFSITKDHLEHLLDRTFTDSQWSFLKDELEDCLDYYFYDELPRIINEMDSDE
jgi:hypothetical protein